MVCADPSGTNIVTRLPPSASDNCAVTNMTCNLPSGSEFPVGETTVTCTATDSSGNQSYWAFTVTVVKVNVTNIKFNHDTGSSATDAINIRQDYATPYDISNGEWIQGG
ncbi:MAG: HYR domain-containing protein, partial [Verrucomicrobiae bacterium]|nr:HYR domain-containing protein [Verrucomicrobiae bacterium]